VSSISLFLSDLTTWLLEAATASTMLLASGYLLAICFRRPTERLRFLQWTLAMTLLALAFMTTSPRFNIEIAVAQRSQPEQAILPASSPNALPENHGVDGRVAFNASPESGPMGVIATVPKEVTPSDSLAERQPANPSANASSVAAPEASIQWWSAAGTVIGLLYVAGMAFNLLRWSVAQYRLVRLLQSSRPAPSTISDEFDRIAGKAAAEVRLRMSPQVDTPITWGLFSPVILLPASLSGTRDRSTLRYFLAHEWSHVRRRDSWTWQMVIALQCLLYYHPMFWIVRRELLISMDRIADAEAAGHGDSSIDYAEFLVRLARQRGSAIPQLTLGVSDKQSQLHRRVKHLLGGGGMAGTVCSRQRSVAIATLAIAIGLASAVVRFETRVVAADPPQEDAQRDDTPQESTPQEQASPEAPSPANADEAASDEPASPQTMTPLEFYQQISDAAEPAVGELLKASVQERADGSITYFGFVRNASNDLPISGATVRIHRKLSRDPKTGGWSTIEVTEHQSNAIGLYSFTLPPEQASESSLYLEAEAKHPKFANKGRGGYSHSMIRKNLEMGELPFYTEIRLWPGEPIEGTIVSPQGEPLKDVEVSMYAESDQATGFPGGSFDKTATDDRGRFRLVPPTPGDGVLWIKSDQYSPQAHRIGDRRGDWGELKLQLGSKVYGRVRDVDGNPVSGVRIEARRRGDGEEADEYLKENAVANQIGRRTVTNEAGEYELESLPAGDYSIRIEANSDEGDYDPKPLEDVFLQQSVTIKDQEPKELNIQAIPHVVLEGSYLDSNDQPRSGHEVTLFGRLDGEVYFTQSSSPGKDGKFGIRIPHGLRESRLDLITNEHSALKWRMSRDQPLQRGRRVELGTIEDDIIGFEVVRYNAPILMVKAVDESGKTHSDIVPIVAYSRPASDHEEMVMYTTGSRVSFEKQSDGRHRSSQLLPDEPIEVTVKKDGYSAEPQQLELQEGEVQTAEFVIKPIDNRGDDPQADDPD